MMMGLMAKFFEKQLENKVDVAFVILVMLTSLHDPSPQ